MHQTKLIQLLNRFDKNEIKEFEAFLGSPFFNTSEKLLTFYKLLIPYHPLYESPKIAKEKLYKKLHGATAYNDQTMRELISSLFKLAKEFISHHQLKHNPIQASNQRYDWLFQRGLVKISEQELIQCEDMLTGYKERDYNFYYQRWLADFNVYQHQSEMMRDREYKLIKQMDFGQHLHSLNKYYLVRFLESYLYLFNMSKIYNTPMDHSIAGHIDSFAEPYIGQGDRVLDILYYMYRLLATGEERYFFELKSLFQEYDGAIVKPIMLNLSVNMENYCLARLRTGNTKFGPELMQVYHLTVERELMLENGELSYSLYRNIVIMGIDSGEKEWVNQFVEKYKAMLPAQFRDQIYDFCRAYILFEDKKYEEALMIVLTLTSFSDFYKIDIKNLTARIQYELGMFEQLSTLLESYPYHLNRESISMQRKENTSLFSGFMKELVLLKHQYSDSSWKKLLNRTGETPTFSNKPWFMEKLAEMSARNH
ncbi:MAG: hypothetical protein JWO03_2558 [Bacteroidetes bacterium]|nr:hypothetical protein [Bacteroidota bacterium]